MKSSPRMFLPLKFSDQIKSSAIASIVFNNFDTNVTQWDTARQISLIFVRDISKSVGCVIIRFLRYYRLTDGMGWGE